MARRRSDNVGWGSLTAALNHERAAQDGRRAERVAGEESGKPFYGRRQPRQHPNSALFEARGRVVRDEEPAP